MNRSRQTFLLFLLIAAGLGARQLAAQLAPAGPEIRVDTVLEDLAPNCPKIGVAPDGSFEIAWDYRQSLPPEVKARHYDASGSPTDSEEVLVAAPGTYARVVGMSPVSTGFRVLLRMIDDPRKPLQFFQRRIDPDGVPAGTPRPVGAATTQWVSSGPGGTLFAGTYSRHRLSVQKVNTLGRPTGKSYILNSRPIDDVQSTPIIALLPGGRWVAIFTGLSVPQPGSRSRPVIRARLFNARGPEGPDFDVNSTPFEPDSLTLLDFYNVVVASSPSGFAISWDIADLTGIKLRLRFYNAAGVAEGDEVTVATREDFVLPVSGAFDSAGRLLLLWAAGTGANPDFQAQLFDASGALAGPSFKPDTAASGAFQKPFCGSVASAEDSWLITWAALTADFQSSAIFLRRFF